MVVDGAVDVSATFVAHVDESTVIILVNIATTASRSSLPPWRGGSVRCLVSGATDSEVNDKGGAHVHGAVDDHVSVYGDRIAGRP